LLVGFLIDCSGRFEAFPEDNAAEMYGLPGPDLYGEAFPNFEYANNEIS
jgi:hypothetical protein